MPLGAGASAGESGDPALQAGYLGASTAFDEALAGYVEAYADQVERDSTGFVKAVRAGKLKSDTGVDQIGGL